MITDLPKVTDAAWDAASALVANLQIVPTNSGGAQIEAHAAGLDVEIELTRDGELRGFCIDVVAKKAEGESNG